MVMMISVNGMCSLDYLVELTIKASCVNTSSNWHLNADATTSALRNQDVSGIFAPVIILPKGLRVKASFLQNKVQSLRLR
jgi:hypothetical protein